MNRWSWILGICFPGIVGMHAVAADFIGAGYTNFCGYAQCIVLKNDNARVVLGPHCGGRVLDYSWKGTNVIFLDPRQDSWVYEAGKPEIDPYGGRFDIGPALTTARHRLLWIGPWKAEIIGARAARLTSRMDDNVGVQLMREFTLDKSSAHLRCRQTIKNVSQEVKAYCHWSRTMAVGGGICAIPLSAIPKSRYPNNYVMYTSPGLIMDFKPNDPNIRQRDGFLEVIGAPAHPMLGLDSYAGWLAYVMKNNLCFVKKYPTYPDRVYNEMAGLTMAIYYYQDKFTELEPIGPRETLPPGAEASFTEDWWLLEYPYPSDKLDLKDLERQVKPLVK